VFVKAGYIIVYQDVRGKYGSEGPYLMTPPPVNSGYNPSGADDTTDGYDTIDWLVKNVPESNHRVGMIGSSYEGFTVVMALLHPHPALKVAAPESPMIDGWMGDDWFHYGAYRTPNIDYMLGQTTKRDGGVPVPHPNYDEYTGLLNAGSTADLAHKLGADKLPFWKVTVDHPAYDGFWQPSTNSSSNSHSQYQPCGSRASGIRRTCGVRTTPIALSNQTARLTP